MTFRRTVSLMAVLAGLQPPGPAKAQEDVGQEATGVLLEATVLISLSPPDGITRVESTFLLDVSSGADEVPISVLTPVPSILLALSGSVDGEPLARGGSGLASFDLEQVRDFYFEGTVRLPTSPETRGDSLALTFSYSIQGAWSNSERATIPLLVPRWVPRDPKPSTFRAFIQLPPGHLVTGSFPTSSSGLPSPQQEDAYEIGLQSVPAMVVLRVAPAGTRSITLEHGLDLAVLVILLVMGALGFRYLRRAT